jgi:hypothetical protein
MQNVSGWETSTLERIGRRIKRYGKLSLADVKSINNVATVKQDMDAITKELARVTGYNISQIEQMYGELLEEQHLANQPLYDYRGKKFVPFAENRELQAIARAYAKTTGETMINLSKISAQNLGVVKKVNGKNVFVPLEKFYTDALDKAIMQVTSGATDFHTAMRETIQTLGGSGMSVNYGGGIHRRLDTAVRQSLLWGAKQASVEYNEMIYDELGCDGYEVDWHSNPRPSHNFMQGKQFVVGKARTINGVHFDSFDEANERLQDYGCLHYKTPIICGVSEPRYSPEELKRLNEQNARTFEINGKTVTGYEATQMQRRLETAVRNEKTTRDLAKASGDNDLVKRCDERIKAYQGKYDEISEITGIQGDKKRMSVSRSVASVKGETMTPKVEKVKRDLKLSKINGTMSVEEVKEFESLVRGRSEIEAVYSKYGDEVSDITRSKNGGAFSPRRKAVDYSFNSETDVSKYSTLSHEMGHAFDSLSADDLPLSYKEVDLINDRCVIGSGITKVLKKSPSLSDDFLMAMRKDKELLRVELGKQDVINHLKSSDASAGVQDFADGMFNTQGRGILRWGHGNSYYNRTYNRKIKDFGLEDDLVSAMKELGFDVTSKAKAKTIMREYETASELWANGVSALTVGGKEFEFMQKYTPNTLDVILKILGGIK